MPDIHTSIIIDAPVEHVHKVFLDFNSYSEWSSFVKSIKSKDGTFEPGSELEVQLEIKPGSITKITPKLLANSPTEFKWVGILGYPWIFKGEHVFEFKDAGDNKTEFIHAEGFAGGLKTPLLWYVKDSTTKGYHKFNESLKKESEKK